MSNDDDLAQVLWEALQKSYSKIDKLNDVLSVVSKERNDLVKACDEWKLAYLQLADVLGMAEQPEESGSYIYAPVEDTLAFARECREAHEQLAKLNARQGTYDN